MRQPRIDPEVRRHQILQAATWLIGLQGYNGLTVQDLARKCGLTNGGLLYHFGSKEQLLVAILEERDRQEAATIYADLEIHRATSGEAKYACSTVQQMFRAIITRSVAQPELLRFYVVLRSEGLVREHPAHNFFHRREAMILSEFTKVLTGHVENPGSAARQILALMGGLEQQWLREDMGFDLLAEFDKAVALVLPGEKPAAETDKAFTTI